MSIPRELQQVIEIAHAAMIRHPQHELIPIHRQNIYRTLVLVTDFRDTSTRAYWGMFTASFVLPIWEQKWPMDSLPRDMLKLAEGVIDTSIDRGVANIQANEAWSQLDKRGSQQKALENPEAFFAGLAAIEGLFETLGVDRLIDISLTEDDTDDVLDPWSSDTAKWAAAAYSGQVGSARTNLTKRREFWDTWLTVGLPRAWLSASS